VDPAYIGKGHPTASQTAWALTGLLASNAGRYGDVISRGVRYLIDTQINGSWDEPWYTGTGFPGYGIGARTDIRNAALSEILGQGTELQRGFMINYNLYRHYFPLAALGRAAAAGH
jgi:squalene-hopene/tetraprenyl-beta-curcumene cyclase